MTNFIKTKLGELVSFQTGPFGTQFSASEYTKAGIPVINVKNIGVGEVISENLDFISDETKSRLSQHILLEGDIVFGRKGSIDRHAYITERENGWVQGSDCIRARGKTGINTHFLSQYLESSFVKKQIMDSAVGSTMPSLNTDILNDILVLLPDIDEQNIISFTLKFISEKVRLNKCINDNLQHQLKLIYDYWFTQFDFPDENGNPYRSSGGDLVWNERIKRNIPNGWTIESVVENSLADVIKPGIEPFRQKTYLATADVNGTDVSVGTIIDFDTRESRANMQPSINSVWFAKMKNSIKHLFLNNEMKSVIEDTILSTGFCGLQCSENSFEYISSFIEHSYFETVKDVLAHGATQEAVNNDDLNGIALIVPSEQIVAMYHERVKPIYAKISANICENRNLTQLRDWLLPMLMNGQATITD